MDTSVREYPNGKYFNEANIFRDSLAWVDIIKENKLTAYTNYLSLFPNGKYVNQALTKITEISASISFTDNRDGKVYKTVVIGDQIWMGENLDASIYQNGDPIPHVQDNNQWVNLKSGAWCYYDNNPEIGKTYGKLYNWYAVSDPRGLAPLGWRIPSVEEWEILIAHLGAPGDVGKKLKESGLNHWKNPNTGTNLSGFTALPGGAHLDYVAFGNLGYTGNWWSSSVLDTPNAWYMSIVYNSARINRYSYKKEAGFSIRCIKDY